MNPIPFTDVQLTIIGNILSALIGAASLFGAQWWQKRKSRKDQTVESANTIAEASGKTVETATKVVDMLRTLLDAERDRFTQELKKEVGEAAEDCKRKIDELDSQYGTKIENLTRDNLQVNSQLVGLRVDYDRLKIKQDDFKARLSKYENVVTDGNLELPVIPK